MKRDADYMNIVSFCESCLEKYGDNYLGVGWTKNKEDVEKRYRAMLEVIRGRKDNVTVLDFGCGASHLYEYILDRGMGHIKYSGLDISEKFLVLSKSKFPTTQYYRLDVLRDKFDVPM